MSKEMLAPALVLPMSIIVALAPKLFFQQLKLTVEPMS
jgi:hypothetical protein